MQFLFRKKSSQDGSSSDDDSSSDGSSSSSEDDTPPKESSSAVNTGSQPSQTKKTVDEADTTIPFSDIARDSDSDSVSVPLSQALPNLPTLNTSTPNSSGVSNQSQGTSWKGKSLYRKDSKGSSSSSKSGGKKKKGKKGKKDKDLEESETDILSKVNIFIVSTQKRV